MRLLIHVLIAMAGMMAVESALRHFAGYGPHAWRSLLIYLALFTLVAIVASRRKARREVPSSAQSVNWPVSGPIARLGPRALGVTFTVSSLFAFLNPFQLVQIVRQIVGNASAQRRASAIASKAEEYRNKADYHLPFAQEWIVCRGGTKREHSHSWDAVAQRYAYDFFVVDDQLRRHSGRGASPSDYFCYDQEILAAADGVVVRTESRIGTAPFVGYGIVDVFARSFIGNHVVVRHAEGEYALYAHLAPNSVQVKIGDRVERGQTIGRCGHTGHSSEPHLHFHLQDREDFFTAAGLPIRFKNLVVDGRAVVDTYIHSGQRVSPVTLSSPS